LPDATSDDPEAEALRTESRAYPFYFRCSDLMFFFAGSLASDVAAAVAAIASR
jgi:hypothetical protein